MEPHDDLDLCNVFVKYLPPDTNDTKLYELFSVHGEIISAKVMVDHQTGNSLGYGFVRFSKATEAQEAIKHLSGQRIQNKTLLCKFSNCSSNPSTANLHPSTNLYIKPLLLNTTEEKLKEIFEAFGKVVDCKVMVDKHTGISRQIGFVRYELQEHATKAMTAMNGTKLEESAPPLVVRYAETEHQRSQRKNRNQQQQMNSRDNTFGYSQVPPQQPMNSHMFVPYHGIPTQMGFPLTNSPIIGSPVLGSPMMPGQPEYSQPVNVPVNNQIQQQPPYSSSPPTTIYNNQYGNQPIPIPIGNSGVIPGSPVLSGSPIMSPPGYLQFNHTSPTQFNSPMLSPQFPRKYNDGTDPTNLFVFHLPSDIDDKGLYNLFIPFGPLESVKVISDKITLESKGYGFVKFVREEDAQQAINHMNGMPLGNKHLKVSRKTSNLSPKPNRRKANSPRLNRYIFHSDNNNDKNNELINNPNNFKSPMINDNSNPVKNNEQDVNNPNQNNTLDNMINANSLASNFNKSLNLNSN